MNGPLFLGQLAQLRTVNFYFEKRVDLEMQISLVHQPGQIQIY
jgi:hypothetical protein